jgi:hypothetical protein
MTCKEKEIHFYFRISDDMVSVKRRACIVMRGMKVFAAVLQTDNGISYYDEKSVRAKAKNKTVLCYDVSHTSRDEMFSLRTTKKKKSVLFL